ncbi:TonB-dependent receptor [Chitinophagaceae bacterium 26-R-25]|nr:TonB-dependent receptor [Chitinophagaceae bacterium 26-R-25]
MRQIYLFLLLATVFSISAHAQYPGGGGGQRRTGGGNMTGRMYGKIVDEKTNKGIDAATIELIQSKFDTLTRKRKDTVITGMLTRSNGDFSLENVPLFGQFRITITAIGHEPIDMKVAFDLKGMQGGDMSAALNATDKDLGNIKMKQDAKVLEGVTVTASKPMVEMKIDRKVFNVDKNITSAGGSGVDVIRNVPSLQVDIDGNVTLRNTTPQLFVDGRPTNLTLDQIPADAIESVEVITNASAKYDASGGNSGILNIVLKKNKKAGYSGNVRANVDSRGKVGGGADLNLRQGKVNVFANINYNQRKSISNGTTSRATNLDTVTLLKQYDKNISNGDFIFSRAGLDYFIDNRNTISVSGNFVRGKFKPNTSSQMYTDSVMPPLDTKYYYTDREANGNSMFRNTGASLNYKHNFAKPGKELTADVTYNGSNNENENFTGSTTYLRPNNDYFGYFNQLTDGGGTNNSFTAQTDYVNPLGEKSKVEMGLRAAVRNVDSHNDIYTVDHNGNKIKLPQLSSLYNNSDKVYAAYATYSNQVKGGKFGYQLGLRAESSENSGTVHSTTNDFKDTSNYFKNTFPISLFPTLFLTQKLGEGEDIQLNYTRKVNRPNFFQLYPFTDYSDSLNLNRGNPNLKPEFTNSIELGYSKTYHGNDMFLATVYYKYTTDLITRSQEKDYNPVTGKAVLVNTYINANSSYVTGLELTGKNAITKWWDVNSNINFFTSKINSGDTTIKPQDNIISYFAKLSNTFKLPKNFTIQLSGDYTSKTVLPPGGSFSSGGGRGPWGGPTTTAQGYLRPTGGVDIAVKYEFLKNKAASISVNMNDIFKTRRTDMYSASDFFVQNSLRTRDAQVVRVNFNYRFGKFDASLFKRKNMKGGQEGMENMGGMGQ